MRSRLWDEGLAWFVEKQFPCTVHAHGHNGARTLGPRRAAAVESIATST